MKLTKAQKRDLERIRADGFLRLDHEEGYWTESGPVHPVVAKNLISKGAVLACDDGLFGINQSWKEA